MLEKLLGASVWCEGEPQPNNKPKCALSVFLQHEEGGEEAFMVNESLIHNVFMNEVKQLVRKCRLCHACLYYLCQYLSEAVCL